ncbi:unnamed protein product [Urochloa decumbens]|uniref:Uncharacterized protein n=1 Tax=Urochloa decumbens TaxID=240449 RepID=A0ABC9ETH3_9POAL
MSKKKAVTTMTLKDFHGGSIPSELPLPSAPGVTPRPADRPVASPNPVAAVVARPRVPVASPNAAAAAAAAMPSFLTTPSRIGRHFDEDERTPFEPATPRRPAPSPTSFAPAPVVAPARSGPGNAWGPRKEAAPVASPVSPAPAPTGGQIWSATRIAQASAVEKVISGRWHPSKPSSPPAPVSAPVVETPVAAPQMERPRSVGVRELDGGVDKGAAPVRPASHEGRVGEGRVTEMPERPKLKLLPRSKPIEAPEPSPTYVEDKQVHQVQVIANGVKVEVVHDVHQNVIAAKTGVLGADAETESRVAERPRLNLKPRSNQTGQSDEIAVKERQSLFGGARPREQVLKDRGVDVLASDLEKTSPVGRSKSEFAKVEQKVEAMSINPSVERVPRNGDRKDYKRDTDRADSYRPTRREDNRRVVRDVEKPPEQPRPEPETWRKPVEPPKPEVTTLRLGKAATPLEVAQAFSTSMSDTLPQSRLTSVPSPRVPPSPGARDPSGFSRLTDNRSLHSSPSQRKINGY